MKDIVAFHNLTRQLFLYLKTSYEIDLKKIFKYFIMMIIYSKEAFVFPESMKEDIWMRAVKEGLHPAADYSLVKHIRLVGMLLIVYAK